MSGRRFVRFALGCVFLASCSSRGANSLELHVPKVVEAEVGKETSISCNFVIPENSSYAYVKWFYMEKSERKEILSKTQDGVDLKESDMKDRVGISDEFALSISKVAPRDARTYWCQVGAGSAGFAEKQAELRVSKTPETSVTVVSDGIGASKDDLSQIATCTSQNGYPTPSITWYKDQHPLYPNGTDPSENIDFVIDGPGKELKEGDQVTLRCKADGYPEPDYTIFKVEDQLLNAPGGELTLEHVKKEDSGTYYCRVFDFESMYELEANVTLSVNYIDVPTITPEHHEALKEGEDLELACDAKGSKPLEFKWKKKGKVVSRGKKLSLFNVTHETLGNYSCVVTMPEVAGLVHSKHVFVNVYSKPSLTGEMHQEYVRVNELISLSCIAVAVPKATILWSAPNGTSGHSHRNGHVNSTLQIRVTPELLKSGINCTAQNNLGLAEHHFSLQKRPDPTPPSTRIDKEARESKGVIIVAVVVGILVIAVLGAVLYFLHKKGKLPCGRSGKQEITRPEAHKDEIVVEVKSDKLPEEAGLLQGANGEKKSAGDQGEKYIDLRN
ncbi:PREDICTED: cell surface glycoprotein MUC18 [Gekko japonicus]|uniref:Cell surface glycoprotein MUC18 n=1 Tax=Gekko japonicus TaxID=146911 RepID=A0ABM1JHN3_GEKJA|nr:PREDICTED: cell surface glycoprotein MUC18 [Gekko japonicus]